MHKIARARLYGLGSDHTGTIELEIMHRKDAIAWVVSVCTASLRLSQAKTLGILVVSAMRVERISLRELLMEGKTRVEIRGIMGMTRKALNNHCQRIEKDHSRFPVLEDRGQKIEDR